MIETEPGRPGKCNAVLRDKSKRCRRPPIAGRTRCRRHGALSFGPRTKVGKDKIKAAMQRRWAKSRRQPPRKAQPMQDPVMRDQERLRRILWRLKRERPAFYEAICNMTAEGRRRHLAQLAPAWFGVTPEDET